ncbi:FecR family protein [Sphingobacterium deserti]|uniref:FecR protein n=1 Tax=Sphingobacterium deserti TaxID=1229276 RepID=A0A0B8T6M5_9SPHI|nr:FecR family protein [Sphingobacterium deserti]KGE12990.1 FecR protein [Sphingobacterium deserti]
MEKAKKLLRLYTRGEASPEQKAVVEKWYKQLRVRDTSAFSPQDRVQQLEEIRKLLPRPPHAKTKEWMLIAAAASIILIMALNLLLYDRQDHSFSGPQTGLINDVAPGDTAATLTMADGTKIRLTTELDGDIVSKPGIRITKTADGQLIYQVDDTGDDPRGTNTLSTNNGQTYSITLPDKSRVWLNAASSLTYSAAFSRNEQRRVILNGEAYFKVAPDKSHPFIVVTDKQEVLATGTEFNINSYTNEPAVNTTLIEGAVKVLAAGKQHLLQPGERATNNGKEIRIAHADIESTIDWKEGDFNFNEVPFRTAMQKIARWYNVEVVYDKSVPANVEARGWVSRNRNLSSVLDLIESSGVVRFEIEGRKVFVHQ